MNLSNVEFSYVLEDIRHRLVAISAFSFGFLYILSLNLKDMAHSHAPLPKSQEFYDCPSLLLRASEMPLPIPAGPRLLLFQSGSHREPSQSLARFFFLAQFYLLVSLNLSF